MSTKTTFKRIALVAVAALGFGLLSAVPSTAAAQSDTLALSATTSSFTTGSASVTGASTVITQTFLGQNTEAMTVTVALLSGPSGNSIVPTITANVQTGANGTPATSGLVGTMTDTVASGYGLASGQWTVALDGAAIPGTYVVKVTPAYSGRTDATVATAATWTVTVAAKATAAAADSTSVSEIVPGAVVTVGSTVAVSVAASGSAIATIKVTPNVASVAATGSATISVTVTGPGTLSVPSLTATTTPATSGLKTTSLSGAAAGPIYVYLFGDGTVGTSTVTSTLGTVVLTETAITYGPSKSAVATVVNPVINSGSGAAAVAGAVTAIVKDAGGNVVNGAVVYAVSGTTTVFANPASATTDSTGKASFSLTGLAAGTSTITIQDVAAGSTATWTSAPVSVRAGSNVASSVSMTLDKATYAPGELATVTVMIKDAAGHTVVDGTYAAFAAAVTSTRALSAGTLPTASLTTGSSTGTLTFKVNAPVTAGDFVISALGGADLAAAQAGLAVSATGTVVLSTETLDAIAAAADAAAEATDAANAATDAANAAAEAADAATAAAQDAADAVASLSAQVATLISGLKAQLTALTNLVIKIQKKVKA